MGYVDCVDTENGHGTHVGGSAVGALSDTSPGEHFGDGVRYSGLSNNSSSRSIQFNP